MKYELVKITELSGSKASLYTIINTETGITLFDSFVLKYNYTFISELDEIVSRLRAIGKNVGAREEFFRFFEGAPGDGVCALSIKPGDKLRLYCIRYGALILILGSGGQKKVRTLQEDPYLKKENYFLRNLSAEISMRIREKEILFTDDGMDFTGNLIFTFNENE